MAAVAAELGHVFLARLGKKRLRPGGRVITDWLMAQGNFADGLKVLEVACNQGTTLCELLAQKKKILATGLDLDDYALEKARHRVKALGLTNRITLVQGNALKLPFEDESFDVVINEAMLTMLGHDAKAQALKEYYRVLKPGGQLLTHDVMMLSENPELAKQLGRTINASVWPLTEEGWKNMFSSTGFSRVNSRVEPMSLLTPLGMIYDEGLLDAMKIFWRGITVTENRKMFVAMRKFFSENKKHFRAIGTLSVK